MADHMKKHAFCFPGRSEKANHMKKHAFYFPEYVTRAALTKSMLFVSEALAAGRVPPCWEVARDGGIRPFQWAPHVQGDPSRRACAWRTLAEWILILTSLERNDPWYVAIAMIETRRRRDMGESLV